jgi:glycosyltransferase involved in cell wall biosynthesis
MNHEQLVRFYNNAIGFVFPSLHETFGMPILEAMACGCPVITSNVCACPEIAGDAALLVNPRSVEDIAAAILRIITESELRNNLREKGLKRSKIFKWEKSAKEHLKVFYDVLKNK